MLLAPCACVPLLLKIANINAPAAARVVKQSPTHRGRSCDHYTRNPGIAARLLQWPSLESGVDRVSTMFRTSPVLSLCAALCLLVPGAFSWTCPAGFLFTNTTATTGSPAGCRRCTQPGTYCPGPATPCRQQFPLYWGIDNSSTVDTSLYPALLRNSAASLYGWAGILPQFVNGVPANGGIPQRGNLSIHLARLATDVVSARALPDANMTGVCCLDYEQWRADWNSTASSALAPYREASINYTTAQHPNISAAEVLPTAIGEFEAAAGRFLQASLEAVQRVRPGCRWGMYAYPRNDFAQGGYVGPLAASMRATNDGPLRWVWQAQDVLLPNIYLTAPDRSPHDGQTTAQYISSNVAEAMRLSALAVTTGNRSSAPPVVPMTWYVYNAYPRPVVWTYLSRADLEASIRLPASLGATGLFLWGSVSTAQPFTIDGLQAYVHAELGPAAQRLTDELCGWEAPARPEPTPCLQANASGQVADGIVSTAPCSAGPSSQTIGDATWLCPVACAAGYAALNATLVGGAAAGNATCSVRLGIVSWGGVICSPCAPGTFTPGPGEVTCTPCASGVSNATRTGCLPASPSATAGASSSPAVTVTTSVAASATGSVAAASSPPASSISSQASASASVAPAPPNPSLSLSPASLVTQPPGPFATATSPGAAASLSASPAYSGLVSAVGNPSASSTRGTSPPLAQPANAAVGGDAAAEGVRPSASNGSGAGAGDQGSPGVSTGGAVGIVAACTGAALAVAGGVWVVSVGGRRSLLHHRRRQTLRGRGSKLSTARAAPSRVASISAGPSSIGMQMNPLSVARSPSGRGSMRMDGAADLAAAAADADASQSLATHERAASLVAQRDSAGRQPFHHVASRPSLKGAQRP
jgi:hypothetical protein